MKAILNDVDNTYSGRLEIVDVAASKKEFCKELGCDWCLKSSITIEGHRFGLVYPKDRIDRGWASVSMVNSTCAPDFLGSYLLFGLSGSGKLISLTQREIEIIMAHFSYDKRDDGRGKYVLSVD